MTRPRAWRDVLFTRSSYAHTPKSREMWRLGRLERPAEWGPMGWFQQV